MLLQQIERFLREHDMPWTRFGRLAVRDPRFVGDLRRGREPQARVAGRVRTFMAAYGEARRGN